MVNTTLAPYILVNTDIMSLNLLSCFSFTYAYMIALVLEQRLFFGSNTTIFSSNGHSYWHQSILSWSRWQENFESEVLCA
jgi:hypothetical protein